MEKELSAQTNITTLAEGNEEVFEEKQTALQNREFARMRRNQERMIHDKKITEEAVLKTAKEILKVNPYTNKEFVSFDEYKDYLSKKSLEENENNEEISSEEKIDNNEEKSSENDEKVSKNDVFEQNEDLSKNILPDEKWFKDDLSNFLSQNPEFDFNRLNNLFNDKDFCEFANDKIGKRPLGEIYKDYDFLLKKVEILSEEKARKMYLKRFSSPGSLMNTANESTTKLWSSMTEQEFETAIKNAKNGMYKNN